VFSGKGDTKARDAQMLKYTAYVQVYYAALCTAVPVVDSDGEQANVLTRTHLWRTFADLANMDVTSENCCALAVCVREMLSVSAYVCMSASYAQICGGTLFRLYGKQYAKAVDYLRTGVCARLADEASGAASAGDSMAPTAVLLLRDHVLANDDVLYESSEQLIIEW
jgi:hypothetical protein